MPEPASSVRKASQQHFVQRASRCCSIHGPCISEPSERLVSEYQLACHDNSAHAIVMPNVKADLIDRFVGAYTAEWRCNSRQKVSS